MNNIAQTIYINLDRRTDRRAEMEAELAKIGLVAERFPAIERKPGALGCGLSHLAILRKAKEEGWENVLILEDDFTFLVDGPTFDQELKAVFDPKIPYDVIMLAYGSNYVSPFTNTLNRVTNAQTTSGYLVHNRFYDTLIHTWSNATMKMEATGDDHTNAIDMAWKHLQVTADWFCFNRRIGLQRPGFSDIVGSFVTYNC
jgi:GR25 family glycosyltransferase involved in LPS biosynthesis